MGCCSSLAKMVLIIFNVIFLLAGIGLTGLGIYFRIGAPIAAINDLFAQTGIPQSYVYSLSYGIIAVGVISMIAGFSGCCGAVKESQCLLGTYLVILVLILGGQIAVAVVAYRNTGEFEKLVKTELGKISLDGNNPNGKTEGSAEVVQGLFKCCGTVRGCQDWTNGATVGCGCTGKANNCTAVSDLTGTCSVSTNDTPTPTSIYTTDCYTAIINFVKSNAHIAAAFAIAVASTEVLGIMFALIMCCNIKNGDYEAA